MLQAFLIVSDEARCLLSLKPNGLSQAKFKLEIGFPDSQFQVYFFPRALYIPKSGWDSYRWGWFVMRKAGKLPYLPREESVMELTMHCPLSILDLIFSLFDQRCLFIAQHWRASISSRLIEHRLWSKKEQNISPPKCWCNPFAFTDSWVMFAGGNSVWNELIFTVISDKELFWSQETQCVLFFGWQTTFQKIVSKTRAIKTLKGKLLRVF